MSAPATGSEMLTALRRFFQSDVELKLAIQKCREKHGWPPTMWAVERLYRQLIVKH